MTGYRKDTSDATMLEPRKSSRKVRREDFEAPACLDASMPASSFAAGRVARPCAADGYVPAARRTCRGSSVYKSQVPRTIGVRNFGNFFSRLFQHFSMRSSRTHISLLTKTIVVL